MKKSAQMFLVELERKIPREAPLEEKDAFLAYCNEMIQDLIDDGYSEEEAIFKLGNPDSLIYDNFESWFVVKEQKVPRKTMPFFLIITILGLPLWGSLLLAVVLIIFSAYLVIWMIPFVVASFAFTGIVGGLAAAVTSLFAVQDGLFVGVTQFGLGVALFGLGILLTIAFVRISGTFIKWTASLTKRVAKLLFSRRVKFV
ncbi:hypothetical protein BAU15_03650 [Enterococcus sp. JM4C]|uniref:DUF1700 domain-containing protein n=1 Tax=Candidatus Enterococcus huntleyi TaxID=1857217 RepID=UPI00137A2917|nr:DUF1700 domain-containing protein [Enterococcus sp. JM4C]KAF1295646.1 hypothetical protein BAU15_03650 [Enterococcus sp. JM4C]